MHNTNSIENHASNMCYVGQTAYSCFATVQSPIKAVMENMHIVISRRTSLTCLDRINSTFSCIDLSSRDTREKVIFVDLKTQQGFRGRVPGARRISLVLIIYTFWWSFLYRLINKLHLNKQSSLFVDSLLVQVSFIFKTSSYGISQKFRTIFLSK